MKVDYPSPRFWIKKTSNATLVRIMEWQLHHRNVVYVKWDSRTRCCILMSQFVRRFLQSQKFSNRTRVQTYVGQDACQITCGYTPFFTPNQPRKITTIPNDISQISVLSNDPRTRSNIVLTDFSKGTNVFIWNVTLWHLNVCKVG